MDIIKDQKVNEIKVISPQIVKAESFDFCISETKIEKRTWFEKLRSLRKSEVPD